jgi:Inhibitor of vertebrate lysozyme (Ivy)
MNTPRTTWLAPRLLGAALLLLCTAPAIWAQGKVDDKLMQRYGGVLAPECGNYLLPQLLYLGDSLVVREGGKAMLTGRNVKAAPTYFGAKPPPEFETAFTSEVAGGDALIFVFYRNASGLFAAVEGGPKVMAAVPAALKGKRVRHCDPNRNVAPGTKPSVEIGPSDLLRDAKFKRPYMQALGPLAKEPWLMELDGPAQPVRKVQVAGNDYQLASVCKNHDCYDNNMVLLYAAASQTVYAKVVQRGHAVLVGAPPPPVVAELERLWRTTYRSGK